MSDKQQLYFGNNWETYMLDIFNPHNQVLGEEFFNTTILKLNKYLKADFVFISRINELTQSFDTLAFCKKDQILKPISFPIEGSLCEKTITRKAPTFVKDAQKHFEINDYFKDHHINTYLAYPLYGSSTSAIGVLTALFSHPKENVKKMESLMFLFSSRIGIEIEHMESKRELKRRNLELLVFKEELIHKNKELDKMNDELKQATLKAKESNKLKTSFLANLSHEVRTPMNAIIGFTELIKSNNLSPDEKTEYLDIVLQNGNQLMRVMDALIDISKLQTKAYIEPLEEISVHKLFEDIYETFAKEIQICKKPISFNILLNSVFQDESLTTYKDALLKVFEHLIENAIKFTHEGEINIGYHVFDDHFEFFVEDTGIGIPDGEEERIFDLFRQANIQNTREFEGNGIGLSIVKKYIEIMHGSIWAEPNREKGAIFRFHLPRTKQ
jgi:signal transduction histidine kinase